MKASLPVCASAFVLTAAAIAWGVLSDAREAGIQSLLESIASAEETVPYVGTRLMGGSVTVKLRILSRGGRKHVDFLGIEGAPRPAARAPGRRLQFGGGLPLVLRPGQDQWKRKVKDAALAARNYDVVTAGQDLVAGRTCDVIEVRARHPGRPSYRVSADVANRFPLRYEVLLGTHRIFETRFADIRYDPPCVASPTRERPLPNWLNVSQRPVPAERMNQMAGFRVLRPTTLPPGFELRGSQLIRVRAEIPQKLRETLSPFLPVPLPKLEAEVVHFTYTDGIAAIAIVECSASSDLWQSLKRMIPGTPSRMVGDKVVARKFSDRGGSAYLLEVGDTVVLAAGNVSAEEIEAMIRTLDRR